LQNKQNDSGFISSIEENKINSMNKQIFISAEDGAKIANVSKVTILKHIKKGHIRAIYDRVRGSYLVDLWSVNDFARNRYLELPHDESEDNRDEKS
jgi:hypothetical protein